MTRFGPIEIIVVLVIVILIFGPARIGKLARDIGAGLREFRNGMTGDKDQQANNEDKNNSV